MRNFIFFVLMTIGVSSCSFFGSKNYEQQYKSPCVDNNGPCKHIPVNNWWLKTELQYNISTKA